MAIGFIRISKELFDHPSYLSAPPAYCKVLTILLNRACFTDWTHNDHGVTISLKPGQICCTIRELATWAKVPQTTVVRATRRFLKDKILEQEVEHTKCVFTISKRYLLQDSGTTLGTKAEQDRNTKEETKEKKEEIKESVSSKQVDLRSILSQTRMEEEIKKFIDHSESYFLPIPLHDATLWFKKYLSPYIYEIFDLLVCEVEMSKVKPGKKPILKHLAWMQRALDKNYPKINAQAKKCMEISLHYQHNGWPNLRVLTRYAVDDTIGKDFYYDNEHCEVMLEREYERIKAG